MNKKMRTIFLIVVIIALISTISYCTAPQKTQTAKMVEIKKTVTGNGYILRKETLITKDGSGVFEPLVKSGVRVAKKSVVGTIISGNLDKELTAELEEVTRRIEEIKNSDGIADLYASDDARIYSAISALGKSIRENVQNEDFSKATEEKNQLNALVEKKYSDKGVNARDQLLVSLEEEKFNIEEKIGALRSDVLAPMAGIFYTELDGMEIIGTSDAASLTTDDILAFPELLEEKDKNGAVAKIVDSYEWYLAATITKEDAAGFKVGSEIDISIDEQPLTRVTVAALNESKTEECVLVVRGNKNVEGITEKRAVEFEIYKEVYSGISVPTEAVRVVDNITGVYVINRNKAVSFKCIDVLTAEKDRYIVNDKYTPPEEIKFEPLKLYDDILINPEAIKANVRNKNSSGKKS